MSALAPTGDGSGMLGPGRFRTISLAELNTRAQLLDRAETKYVVGLPVLRRVITELSADFDLLAIDGNVAFGYESVYFDSDSLVSYREHAQGKRRRFKVRSRRYVDTNQQYVEVKLKGVRGRTIKRRLPITRAEHGRFTSRAQSFIGDTFREVYGTEFNRGLKSTLTVGYRRLTLVSRSSAERVTIDVELRFAGPDGSIVEAPTDFAIVEVKSAHGRGIADQVLRAHSVRPQPCSKYVVGLNLVLDGLRYNRFKRVLARYFGWQHSPRPASGPAASPDRGRGRLPGTISAAAF